MVSRGRASRRLVGSLAIASALAAIVACQVVAGIEPVEKQQRGVDGGPDGRAEGDGGSDPCHHVLPPGLPEGDDPEEIPPIALALRSVKFIPTPSDRYQGFDLDGTCSCDKRPLTAHDGEGSCTPKKETCDGDGGVDNSAAGLFDTFAPTGFSPDDGANDGLDDGRRGLLLIISKYNGKANDREVNVGAMITHGILDGSGCGTTPNPQSGHAPPGWCGRDLWTYSQQYARPGSKEPLFVGKGYVNDNELVFNAPTGELKMFFAGSVITFGSPISAGRLTKTDGQWKLDGVLTGRIPITELLKAVGGVKTDQTPLCQSPYFAGAVQPELCKRADIATTANLDFAKPKGNCGAISTVILFRADEAQVGEERSEADPASECDGVDPALFQCP